MLLNCMPLGAVKMLTLHGTYLKSPWSRKVEPGGGGLILPLLILFLFHRSKCLLTENTLNKFLLKMQSIFKEKLTKLCKNRSEAY